MRVRAGMHACVQGRGRLCVCICARTSSIYYSLGSGQLGRFFSFDSFCRVNQEGRCDLSDEEDTLLDRIGAG